jgi:hypothetical protein
MSDSWGAVKFNDGLIKYYLYHGSSDTCYTSLYDKVSDVAVDYTECNCGKSEPVEIYSDYGGGFYWKGKACRDCDSITKGSDFDDGDYWGNNPIEVPEITDGKPKWIDREKINNEWWGIFK